MRVQHHLREHGCAVKVALSCEEAVARLDALTRCAIIDLVLPDGSGVDLAERLVTLRPGLPCIYLTAHQRDALPPGLPETNPIVHKSSGLMRLRVELAKALGSGVAPVR